MRPHRLQPTRLLCPRGSSQARILECVVICFSRRSSQPRDQTCVSCTAGRFLTTEPLGKHHDKVLDMTYLIGRVFPVVMYGCENWTMKKAEHRKIDAFELWCWRRLLRVPWTARRSIQSILKEISPGCSLEGLMMKLKLQYFGHLM